MGAIRQTGNEGSHTHSHHHPGPWYRDSTDGPRATSPRSEMALRGSRVLVVDDNADMRDLLMTIFEQSGAQVTTAASAAEALDAIKRSKPDVLISDIGMPDEDGYDLIRRVRAAEKISAGGLPAVALTAHTQPEDRQQALASGYQIHMPKPVEPADLVKAVADLIRKKRES